MEKLNYKINFKRGIFGKSNREYQGEVDCSCSECDKDFKDGDEYWYPIIINNWFEKLHHLKSIGAYPQLTTSNSRSGQSRLDIDFDYVICKMCKEKRTKLGGRNSSQA